MVEYKKNQDKPLNPIYLEVEGNLDILFKKIFGPLKIDKPNSKLGK